MEAALALSTETGRTLTRTVRVEGRSKSLERGRVTMTTVVDDSVVTTRHGEATANEALYVAAQKAMRKADADGVTHLRILSGNALLEGHMEAGWQRKQAGLHPFQEALDALVDKFDDVVWS